MKRFFIFVVVLFLIGEVSAQELRNIYGKIEKKLVFDRNYLNLFYFPIELSPEDVSALTSVPRADEREPYSFRKADNISYQIVFLKETIEVDSITILYVKEIVDKSAGDSLSFFGETSGGPQIDTNIVLRFKDISELYFSSENKKYYDYVYSKIINLLETNEEPQSLLTINIDEQVSKGGGITSADNKDFINFSRVNGIHRFPKDPAESAPKRGRKKAVETSVSEYQVDASFSRVSFFHKSMDFGFSSISAEMGFGTPVLNVLPWQSMTMSLGIRSLVSITGDISGILDAFIIDAKLLGRTRLNTSSFASSLPFLYIDKPRLNVGPGIMIDLSGSRAYGLPFFNLFFSTGSEDFSSPFTKFGKSDSADAYFTTKQWEMSMSFYWNNSEQMTVRFRMDVGVGNYDVVKANYYRGISKKLVYNQIQPVISTYITFVPKGNEFFGSKFRIFDNVLGIDFWMKVFEMAPSHLFRFETSFLSPPMFRSLHPWESEGGSTMVQVRYRYGF